MRRMLLKSEERQIYVQDFESSGVQVYCVDEGEITEL